MDIKNEWLHSKRFNQDEEVQLTGLRFKNGTIDFWTVDKNDHISDDLTFEVMTKPGNPDKEVAVSSPADTEFLKENGLIQEKPNSQFEEGNSTYYVYSLTDKGLSAAEQLPMAKERNIDAFYAVFDQDKDKVNEVIYAESEQELWDNAPELGRYQYLIPVKDVVESGLSIPIVEIDHGYTIMDLIYDIELEGFDYQAEQKEKEALRIDFALSGLEESHLRYLDFSNQKRMDVDQIKNGKEIDIDYYDLTVVALYNAGQVLSDEEKTTLDSVVEFTTYEGLSEGIGRQLEKIPEKQLSEVNNELGEIDETQELGR